jgi:hypothetical protein
MDENDNLDLKFVNMSEEAKNKVKEAFSFVDLTKAAERYKFAQYASEQFLFSKTYEDAFREWYPKNEENLLKEFKERNNGKE